MKLVGVFEPDDLRALREARRWTQADLARLLGTDTVTVSRWERGVSHPRPAARRRLCSLGLPCGPRGSAGFVEDPAVRIRKVDRARLEQLSFKRRARRLA